MDQGQSEQEMLRQFVEAVAKESGVQISVPDAVEAISNKIDEEIVRELPHETMSQMVDLQDRGEATDEKVEALLDASGVDPTPIVNRVLMAFRDKLMERGRA